MGIIGPRGLSIQNHNCSDPRSAKALETDLQTLDTEYSTLGDWMAKGEQDDFSPELLGPNVNKSNSMLATYYQRKLSAFFGCHCKSQVGQAGRAENEAVDLYVPWPIVSYQDMTYAIVIYRSYLFPNPFESPNVLTFCQVHEGSAEWSQDSDAWCQLHSRQSVPYEDRVRCLSHWLILFVECWFWPHKIDTILTLCFLCHHNHVSNKFPIFFWNLRANKRHFKKIDRTVKPDD